MFHRPLVMRAAKALGLRCSFTSVGDAYLWLPPSAQWDVRLHLAEPQPALIVAMTPAVSVDGLLAAVYGADAYGPSDWNLGEDVTVSKPALVVGWAESSRRCGTF